MSIFNHPICDICFAIRYPGRNAVRVVGRYRRDETCCACRRSTRSGIYIREDPNVFEGHVIHT